ncbi:DUF3857 domain-containing protein [Paraflavitalea speifideaquila]|uniref:DUF3857 domain-containing protein n=1 Tax=Paraflavitalea speifideaquila TaxID=3076558 RepID=UPI0028E9BE6E|nr:DUF3857 domain-containing protein [Paraflavitalea speifideiaquila]
MKKRLLIAMPALCWCCLVAAQLPSYDVASIPEEAKKKTSVIKRYENTIFEVTGIDRATLKTHEVYTLLNDTYRGALNFSEYNNKFHILEDVEIKVYDAKGKQINKYRKKDLYMQASSGDGLIDDRSFYSINIPVAVYPVTVEYIYEVRYKGTLFYPWYTPGHGVLQSTFTAKVPKDMDLRYLAKNVTLTPKITEEEKYKTYQWDGSNLPRIEQEEGSTSSRESIYPCIVLAPSRFKMDEYDGNMSSWKSLGAWYNTMHKGLDVLPESRVIF